MNLAHHSRMIKCAGLLSVLFLCGLAAGQVTEKVLYQFNTTAGGFSPWGNMVFDEAGNLYGTTEYGGKNNGGVVFELSANSEGGWSETVLYDFCSQGGDICPDGVAPEAGLTIDAKGNLYGTTIAGGLRCDVNYLANTCGTVFELNPPSAPGGAWIYTVLHRFCTVRKGITCLDGAYPGGPLIFDAAGNLYGEASAGGNGHNSSYAGLVFELSPGSSGWTQKVLYNFCSLGSGQICPDGSSPWGGLTFDSAGNLYGTTTTGGATNGGGAVFSLVPSNGKWTETVLQSFPATAQNPDSPSGGVVIAPNGDLYGTITNNGKYQSGGVFLLPANGGKVNLLWFNTGNGGPGGPNTPLLLDTKRHMLYGASPYGGADLYGDGGTVFQISENGTLSILYSFCSQPKCADGQQPEGPVIEDKAGNLYGMTYATGVVYEIEMIP